MGLLVGVMLALVGGPEPAWPRAMNDSVSARQLEVHVTRLAGEIGERNVFQPQALAGSSFRLLLWRGQYDGGHPSREVTH